MYCSRCKTSDFSLFENLLPCCLTFDWQSVNFIFNPDCRDEGSFHTCIYFCHDSSSNDLTRVFSHYQTLLPTRVGQVQNDISFCIQVVTTIKNSGVHSRRPQLSQPIHRVVGSLARSLGVCEHFIHPLFSHLQFLPTLQFLG